MNLGRYAITFDKAKRDHQCGQCKRNVPKGAKRMTISSGYTYPTHICTACVANLNAKLTNLLKKGE